MRTLAQDIRIAEILNKVERYRDVQRSMQEIEIIETEAMVDGVPVILFQHGDNGVYIRQSDIDSGEMTREDGYRALAEMV